MPDKAVLHDAERTPLARLAEGALQAIVGYQLAQAEIVTDRVFDACVRHRDRLRRIDYTILALVLANPGLTARQLARALAVTPPNVTLCLDRLAARDLLTRTRGAQDARLQHIQLSDAGEALAAQATQRLIEGEKAALNALSAAERAMLAELLHKVALGRKRNEP